MELDKIYHGDCLELMKEIPDASVDMVLCDLPYGTTKNPWDSIIPLDKLWEQYKRVLKPKSAVVLFAQQPFASMLVASNYEWFKYEWIWEKSVATGFLNSKFAPLKKHEDILVFSEGAACHVKDPSYAMPYNPQFRQGKPYSQKAKSTSKNYDYKAYKPFKTTNDGSHYYPFAQDKDKLHPTQKPVDLLRYLIRTYTDTGMVVLDNCIGSGSTAIAAIREDRHFIGMELTDKYYDVACERVNKELSKHKELNLFDD